MSSAAAQRLQLWLCPAAGLVVLLWNGHCYEGGGCTSALHGQQVVAGVAAAHACACCLQQQMQQQRAAAAKCKTEVG
jgi:hypothetical protein